MQSLPPQSILVSLDQALEKFSMPSPGELASLTESLDITTQHLRQLQQWARDAVFPDATTEIQFFKHVLPAVEGKLLFYSQAILLEQYLPARSMEEKIAYYRDAYLRIDRQLLEMAEFFRYYQMASTHLDSLYFQRQSANIPVSAGEFLLSDPRLRTPRSLDMARIVGLKALEAHLDARIWLLLQPLGTRPGPAPLTWHASRSALTELIYALLEVKAFGSEAPDVKRISEYFQQIFHVQIANIYATYEDNRLRKKNRTPFLDALKNALERRMDHDDLHAL